MKLQEGKSYRHKDGRKILITETLLCAPDGTAYHGDAGIWYHEDGTYYGNRGRTEDCLVAEWEQAIAFSKASKENKTMPKLEGFTFGTDPEFFIGDGTTGRLVSMINELPPKDRPIDTGDGHRIYHDNMLAECAVKPASSTHDAIKNIGSCITHLKRICREINRNWIVFNTCAESFSQEDLHASEEAMVSGCVPEFDAYDFKKYVPDAEKFRNSGFRTAGGHIHLGHPIIKEMGYFPIVHALDICVGYPLICASKRWEQTFERLKFYGGPGRFRITDYGLEYRTPSNEWLFSKNKIAFVYDMCENICESFASGYEGHVIIGEYKPKELRTLAAKFFDDEADITQEKACNYWVETSALHNILTYMRGGKASSLMLTPENIFNGDFCQWNKDYVKYYESICSTT